MFDKRKRQGGNRNKQYAQRDRPMMHPAICSECDKECEVPFKPNGSKPVFCRDCFKRESSGGRASGAKSFTKPSGGGMTSGQFETLNSKLDQILVVLNSGMNS